MTAFIVKQHTRSYCRDVFINTTSFSLSEIKKLRANPFTGILQCTLLVGTPHHQRTLLVGTPLGALVGIPLGALVGTPHHHLRKIVRLDIHKNQIKISSIYRSSLERAPRSVEQALRSVEQALRGVVVVVRNHQSEE
jgi:hypothetical protein